MAKSHYKLRSACNTALKRQQVEYTGWYMFISSSGQLHINDTARLSSSPVNGSMARCLSFWYLMYGPDVNTLNVYTKKNSVYGNPVWKHVGTVDSNWHQAVVTLLVNSTYSIVFEGVRGTRFSGVIAIDDITVTDGTCGSASISSCTFEDPVYADSSKHMMIILIGHERVSPQLLMALVQLQITHLAPVEPLTACGQSYTGRVQVLHVHRASLPQHPGNRARLISPSQPATSGSCLRFWYYMYGHTMGTLSVYLRSGGQLINTIFNISGNQGNRWIQAEITVHSSGSWEAVFEGVVGSGYSSDIAIDDVSILSGSCGAVSGGCNFDVDMCTWSNVQGDNFDWMRTMGATPTQYTGPSVDHTQDSVEGGFVFIESSAPRVPGDRAWLVSQPFTAFRGSRCLIFWYHMYGSGIGSLNVYLDDTANTSHTKLWMQSDNKGEKWLQGQIPLPSQSKEYQIRFEGVRGQTFFGDIALDDISFTSVPCIYKPPDAQAGLLSATSPAPTSSTLAPFISQSPYDCSFESDYCSWKQDDSDDFDWNRGQGPSGTVATGPFIDHTLNSNNGWYIFIGTAAVQGTRNTAQLVSAQILANSSYCLQFWYYMYGPHIDTLDIYVRQKNGDRGASLWTKSQSQGNHWNYGQVQIAPFSNTVNIVFEAVRGPTFRGYIGLDDIRAVAGSCVATSGLVCDFESGLCGWNQTTADNFDWTLHSGQTSTTNTGPF
ncbi:MAM and LDL-receptor class A domain-containing protein 1-like [Pomacea canaliculata]|uniref:MAM and LDL-receptor class A domain-containing protein 1-like n=1 Tax=Pomacea canaliculata TaxID=400727 RepID=UPI000D738597|nr:MAM and LDL-receptor class A domain-containing protein 1-like [Pomacea canaliculata]